MINELDANILTILQRNSRTSNAEIARQVRLAPSAVFERIRKLEEKGIVQSYTTRIDPHAVGLGLVAFTFVRSNDRPGGIRTAELLAEIPEVLEVHHVAGEDCFLVKVRAADTEALGRLLRERLGKISTISSTRTTIVLESVKETSELPIAREVESEEAASA
ncbi:MAG TPA: Lrp/AsnC family transcriptional regulator [Thermoanaerobaculia bacterium]